MVYYLPQFSQSFSPMADLIFFFYRELGHGLSILRKFEERVISKPFLAHSLEPDPALT